MFGQDEPAATAPATEVAHVSLQQLDTTEVTVVRGAFCDRIDDEAVTAGLGATAIEAESYGDGDPVRFTPRVEDVAHEFGCVWSRGGQRIRAWVFAPPITASRANGLIAQARSTRGCALAPDAAEFGAPSVALLCRTGKGRQVSYRGLFGDAWLSCSVVGRVPDTELVARANRFCATVVVAAAAD